MRTYGIVETIYRNVAEHYEIRWQLALQIKTSKGSRFAYPAKAVATYLIATILGKDAVCELLGITISQVNTAYYRVLGMLSYDKPLRELIASTNKDVNIFRN